MDNSGIEKIVSELAENIKALIFGGGVGQNKNNFTPNSCL